MGKWYSCPKCGGCDVRKDGKPYGKQAIYCKSCNHRSVISLKSTAARINNAKILLLDIETAPVLGYVWRIWREDVGWNRVVNDWFALCWAAKWLHEPNIVYSDSVSPDDAIRQHDGAIMKSVWKLVNSADIVVAHNGVRFDIPKLNTRFIIHGLDRPLPYQQIDTLKVLKKNFAFSSNKLDFVNGQLKITKKMPTEFKLWERCYRGDSEALQYMEEYNRTDVIALEELYLRLRPWIDSHPNVSLFSKLDRPSCSYCGSTKLSDTGNSYSAQVGKFRVYRCENCHSLPRGRETTITSERRKNILRSIAR